MWSVNASSHIQRPGVVWLRAASSPREAEAQKVESLFSRRTHIHAYIRIQVSFLDCFFSQICIHIYVYVLGLQGTPKHTRHTIRPWPATSRRPHAQHPGGQARQAPAAEPTGPPRVFFFPLLIFFPMRVCYMARLLRLLLLRAHSALSLSMLGQIVFVCWTPHVSGETRIIYFFF
jgi:hypothetical protein